MLLVQETFIDYLFIGYINALISINCHEVLQHVFGGGSTLYAWHGMVSLSAALSWPRGKSQRSYNTAVLPKNPMFHFLFVFGSFLRFRRRVWFTVAVFGSFLISFLVHFYCQPSSVGGKNEPKMKSKMRQKRPKSATVSTPIFLWRQ